jgi:hypothetical protein
MNRKKLSFTLLLCGIVLAAFVTLPVAANALDVASCTIAKIGVDPRFEGAPVQLVDTSGVNWTGNRQFYLSSSLGNQGLAVLLTAYSMGKTVWVRAAGDGSPGSLLTVIFVND